MTIAAPHARGPMATPTADNSALLLLIGQRVEAVDVGRELHRSSHAEHPASETMVPCQASAAQRVMKCRHSPLRWICPKLLKAVKVEPAPLPH